MTYSRIYFFFLCYRIFGIANTQQRYFTTSAPSVPETSNFIKRGYHSSIVLGNYLYIDGGNIWQMVDGNFFYGPNNATLSIDLTESWTNATVTFNTINKTVFSWNSAYLWPDASTASFYQWGGQPSQMRLDWETAGRPSALYRFQADGHGRGEWAGEGQSSTSIFGNLRRGFGGAAASRGDMWYMVGGVTNCASDLTVDDCRHSYALGPMISYNSTSNLWTNDSAQDFIPSRTTLWSRMHHIPSGHSDGLNVILGGGTAFLGSGNLLNNPSDLLDFQHIYIYDPTTKTFHNQTATGTPPAPRIRFCSVATPGSNGSYEIFIYGGFDPRLSPRRLTQASDEVFVLSLPGFVWFKADYPATNARITHSCDIVGRGGSQMLVTGGVDPNNSLSTTDTTPDPWTNGLHVFDLSAMRWKDSYEADDPLYQTPQVVRDWYAENGQYPVWDYPAVESLFVETPVSDPSNLTLPTSNNTANTGAIAGGVIGGVAVLAVIAGVVYYISHRRRQGSQRTQYHKPELEGNVLSANANHQQPMLQRQLTGGQRHEADTIGAVERHEMS